MRKMCRLVAFKFVQDIFGEEEYDYSFRPQEKRKLFPERYGFGWSVLRFLVSTLFSLCHLILALIFISFFVSAIAFSVTAALDMAFEMITPVAETQSEKDFRSACLFFLLFSLLIVACLILSLFWEVLKVVLLKNSISINVARVAFVFIVLVASGVWVGIERAQSNQVSFAEYIEYAATVSWILAFDFSLFGSVVLLIFLFTHCFKNNKILAVLIAIVFILVAFAMICTIAFGIVANQKSPGITSFVFLLPCLAAVLIMYTYCRGKEKDNKSVIFHKGITLLFLGFFLFVIILTSYLNAPTTCTRKCKDEARKHAEAIDRIPFSSTHYQICSKRWTSIDLNIAELAFLANLTYNREVENGNSTAVEGLANEIFKSRSFNWKVKNVTKTGFPHFFHLQYNKVNVIMIKGPVTTREFVESAKLWDEVAVLQSVAFVVPLINHFSTKFISEYVSKTSFINRIFDSGSTSSRSFQTIEDYVKAIKKANSAIEVLLVGHSFGGGIAKIIGARQQLPAVSFSSPGIAYGHVKFGFSLENALKFGVSISPQNDNIPLLDKHVGLQQTIQCDGKTFEQCHRITRTYCELHNGCGLAGPGCQSVLDN
ncbi:hypothetical protein QZH41_002659 [Actinostola sp. cb2023]|nr:hypothetical protein QZH41_002659 [Actinostola sp. cb2023]